MTLCNMTIEAGARAGLVAPDETTFAYLMGRPAAPKGAAWAMALSGCVCSLADISISTRRGPRSSTTWP